MEKFIDLEIDAKFIDESIVQEVYIQSGFKTSICVLMLNTGFEVVGSFTDSVSPADVKKGKDKAKEDAVAKIERYFIQLNSWRFAVYTSEKVIREEQAKKEEKIILKNKQTPSQEPTTNA